MALWGALGTILTPRAAQRLKRQEGSGSLVAFGHPFWNPLGTLFGTWASQGAIWVVLWSHFFQTRFSLCLIAFEEAQCEEYHCIYYVKHTLRMSSRSTFQGHFVRSFRLPNSPLCSLKTMSTPPPSWLRGFEIQMKNKRNQTHTILYIYELKLLTCMGSWVESWWVSV